jgi:hypothetical protein
MSEKIIFELLNDEIDEDELERMPQWFKVLYNSYKKRK